MPASDTLFRSFKLKTLSLPNRIVMAPMSRSFSVDGVPGQAYADYYRRRAEGGVGLILSESSFIDRPASANDPAGPLFHGEEPLAEWSRIVDSVHQAGGRMGPQLMHAGAANAVTTDWDPPLPSESPSARLTSTIGRGGSMTEADIAATITAFANAAAKAKHLGFDTVEIHGAHGYLIDQFFWNATNGRTDRYGGQTQRERARFGVEVIAAVRDAVGPDFPILLRLSQWKSQDYSARMADTPAEMQEWLLPLVEAGADVLHCSQRRFWEPEFPEIDGAEGLNFAGWAKHLTGAATISVGAVGLTADVVSAFNGEVAAPAGVEKLIRRMERDEFDLIAVGRALITDPDWANKVRLEKFESMKPFGRDALSELV